MIPEPEVGQVIRYDFLWKNNRDAGQVSGKDRPCAIILMTRERSDGSRRIVVCPITHVPPAAPDGAVAMPPKVARHLGLDEDPMWVKTDQLNEFEWRKSQIPVGISPLPDGGWVYGKLPQSLGKEVFEQVRDNYYQGVAAMINRDDG